MHSELRSLVALSLIPGIGPRLTQALFDRFGSYEKALQAQEAELLSIPHLLEKTAQAFARALSSTEPDEEIRLAEQLGVKLLMLGEPAYPPALRTIPNPPHLLYKKGELETFNSNAVGIVGSRNCTSYGKRMAEKIASGLARAGWLVVSGLALGIDAAAHRGALEAGGKTIGVLANGLASIYPPEHKQLGEDVCASGCLISESPLKQAPMKGTFHRRNRIISGLSRATVVIEANETSGALITVKHALEQGREVFAVPGNADSYHSGGCLRIIREGARLIRDVNDLLEDLQGIPMPETPARLTQQELFPDTPSSGESPAEAASQKPISSSKLSEPVGLTPDLLKIWQFLTEAKHADLISRELEIPINQLTSHLMMLEMKKLIRRLPGNLYERRES